MDDLTAKLNQILSDPESLNQIKNMAAALGLGGTPSQAQPQPASAPNSTPPPPPPPAQPQPQQQAGMPDLSALASLLGAAQQQTPPPPPTPPLIDPATLGMIVSALSKANSGNDKNIELLRALKPHFSDQRRGKVDDAIRLIQLFSLLPIIRETGLFSGLFGGDKK